MRYLFALFAVTLLLCACAGDRSSAAPGSVLQRVTAAKAVRIGVKVDAPPFSVRRGDYFQGFDIDIAEAVMAKLGIEHIDYVPVTTEQRSDALVTGTVDVVVASMTQTRYRERRVDFTIPYFQDGQCLLVRNESPVQTYQDLRGHRIGVEKGSTSSFYIKQVCPDAQVVLYPDATALRQALEDGTEDAITSDLLLLIGLRKQAKIPSAYRITGQRFTTEPYAMAVPQDQSAWRNALNHALLDLWEDGTWQRIANTWFGPSAAYEHRINFAIMPYPK
jgi:polar amino acid transport system substrate-binding protein